MWGFSIWQAIAIKFYIALTAHTSFISYRYFRLLNSTALHQSHKYFKRKVFEPAPANFRLSICIPYSYVASAVFFFVQTLESERIKEEKKKPCRDFKYGFCTIDLIYLLTNQPPSAIHYILRSMNVLERSSLWFGYMYCIIKIPKAELWLRHYRHLYTFNLCHILYKSAFSTYSDVCAPVHTVLLCNRVFY